MYVSPLLFVLVGRAPIRHEVVLDGKILGYVTQLDTKDVQGQRRGLFIGGRLKCERVGQIPREADRFNDDRDVENFFLQGTHYPLRPALKEACSS